jgi:hypothetical protein
MGRGQNGSSGIAGAEEVQRTRPVTQVPPSAQAARPPPVRKPPPLSNVAALQSRVGTAAIHQLVLRAPGAPTSAGPTVTAAQPGAAPSTAAAPLIMLPAPPAAKAGATAGRPAAAAKGGPATVAATDGAATAVGASAGAAPSAAAPTSAAPVAAAEGAVASAGAEAKAAKPRADDRTPVAPAEGSGPAAGASGPGTAAGGAVLAAVLLMPAPPKGLSPATKQRVAGVSARAGGKAAAHGALPPAASQVGDARQAVTPPDAERAAAARAALIAQVQAAPSPEIVKLCEHIREVIRNKRPPDEDALVAAKPEGEALDAGNQLNATVQDETKKVQDNYGAVGGTPPTPGATPAPGVPPQPATAPTPPINAKAAVPDAVPAENVSLTKDAEAAKKQAQDAGMDTPAAQLVTTGPIAEARNAQGELDKAAAEDPVKVMAKQQAALGQAEGDMAALQMQALTALTASREGAVKGTGARQRGMVGSEEQMRIKAGTDAKKAFDDAQTMVNAQLKDLPATARAEWDAAKTVLVANFKNDLAIVKKNVDARHEGASGFVVGLWDAVAGLPDWAIKAYDAAEKNFGDGVTAKLTKISTDVNAVIAACDLIIKGAREKIASIFAELPVSLQGWAAQEQAKFDGQLDQLHNQVIATRDNFDKELIAEASAAVDEVRAEIAELRLKAGGLVGRIANAIQRFIEDPVKAIIEGLLTILGIPPAAFWAVIAKIKQVAKDIAADPMNFANNLLKGLGQGFSLFFDNFAAHMVRGFLSWLLGDLKGVQVPKDLSLRSIVTFFLQLMGITWPNIRKILVDKIGAKNVALIEKVYSLVSLLMEKGPEGIYEMIKEKLEPQAIVDQVIDMAVDYMVTAVAKAVGVRLLLLFNPAGAIAQALEAIYRVLKWVFQNAARIFTLVETVVNGMADIIAGNVGGFAKAVEKGLGMLIAPVLSFIADYMNFGDLPATVAKQIKAMQKWILGIIEKVIVWIIEKGKALLAAVGIGKKDKENSKETIQVGEDVNFDADGEPHRLWIDVVGERATLMVASKQQTVKEFLAYAQLHGPPDVKAKARTAANLANKSDTDADQLAKIAVHISKQKESEPRQDLTKQQAELKGEEKNLADLLIEIFEGMQTIDPYLGGSVDKIDSKKTPFGYDLWNDQGTYEYGGSYQYTEIQRGSGFGSADEKTFPKVHVDKGGLVQKPAGILRSDWEVIDAYRIEMAAVVAKLDDDGAPIFKGGAWTGPANSLEAGEKRDRSFNRGIRKQMESIIHAIRTGTPITGVEVVVGQKRVDYTALLKISGKVQETMIEYKHWTGRMAPVRAAQLGVKLEAQLRGQIIGGGGKFAVLKVEWPAFHTLDEDSQELFHEAIDSVIDFGAERGVKVIFSR